jgi:quercetin dioxygenase-like cupin family protein
MDFVCIHQMEHRVLDLRLREHDEKTVPVSVISTKERTLFLGKANPLLENSMSASKSHILRFRDGYGWDGVEQESYKQGQDEGRAWHGIIRQVLIGKQDEATTFHLRYFEVAAGGYSSLEKHAHAHVVVAVRGTGHVVLNQTAHTLTPLDTVYVAPWTPHQFLAADCEPFGFFCIVDAERDQPQALSAEEHAYGICDGALVGC